MSIHGENIDCLGLLIIVCLPRVQFFFQVMSTQHSYLRDRKHRASLGDARDGERLQTRESVLVLAGKEQTPLASAVLQCGCLQLVDFEVGLLDLFRIEQREEL